MNSSISSLQSTVAGKQDKLPLGQKGQVWTANSTGNGNWEDVSSGIVKYSADLTQPLVLFDFTTSSFQQTGLSHTIYINSENDLSGYYINGSGVFLVNSKMYNFSTNFYGMGSKLTSADKTRIEGTYSNLVGVSVNVPPDSLFTQTDQYVYLVFQKKDGSIASTNTRIPVVISGGVISEIGSAEYCSDGFGYNIVTTYITATDIQKIGFVYSATLTTNGSKISTE